MPLYEYECEVCGHRFEVIQRFSDPPVDACTQCGGAVRKLLSPPAIQFKGSGWYITDYARKGGTSAPTASSNGDGETKKATEAATASPAGAENKPAATTTPGSKD